MPKNIDDKSVKHGLALLKLGWFLQNFLLIVPVIVLVYTQKGVTVGDFFLIQGLFRLAAFLFEVPSGYLSDCFSRKQVMIWGAIFSLAGYFTIAIAYGFWALVLGESLLGISSALFTGTLEAYTYDLLKRNKTQKQFLKEYGNIETFSEIASFIAVVSGGVLFGYIGINILWIEIGFALLSVFAFLVLPELLEVRRVVKRENALNDAISISTKTLKNPKLRNLIIFPSLFGAFAIVLFWMLQPIMETVNIPVGLFGVYIGLNQLSGALFAKYAYKICDKFGEFQTSFITIGAIVLCAVMGLLVTHIHSMPIIYVACVFMAIIPSMRILNNLQYKTLIHHTIKSNERGTVLSTRAMVSTVSGAIFLIVAKFLMDGYGITTTLMFVFVMTFFLVWSLKNTNKYIK